MVLQEAGNNWSLHTQKQLFAFQSSMDNVEVIAASSKQHWVIGECAGRLFPPSLARNGAIRLVVVQFCPEQLLERLLPLETVQEIEYGLLTLGLL